MSGSEQKPDLISLFSPASCCFLLHRSRCSQFQLQETPGRSKHTRKRGICHKRSLKSKCGFSDGNVLKYQTRVTKGLFLGWSVVGQPCGRSGGNSATNETVIQVKANSGWHSHVSHVFLCWDSSQIHSHSALTFPLMSRVWTTKKVVKPQHLCCAARKVECLQVPQYRCEAEAKVPSLHSS